MKTVSDGFLAASGRYYARLALADGSEVESDDILSLSLSGLCNGASDRLTLGASPSACLTGKLAVGVSLTENGAVTLYLGKMVDGALEEYQMGVFTVTEALAGDDGAVSFTAYDANNVAMANTTYVPGTATTARAVLAELCEQAGVTLGDTGTLADVDVTAATLEGYTCRELAGYMAALLGGNAWIDPAGQLRVGWFTESGLTVTADDYYSGGLSLASSDWSLDVLACEVTTTTTETTTDDEGNTTTTETTDTETLLWGSGTTSVGFTNPWMTQERLDVIGETIGGLSYRSGTVSIMGDLRMEPGDIITVTDGDGVGHTFPVMALTLDCDGGLKATLEAYAQTESSGGGTGSTGPLSTAVSGLVVTVAEIQNLTAENLTATNAKIASLNATAAELEDLVAQKASVDDLTAVYATIENLSVEDIKTGIIKSYDYAYTEVPCLYPAEDLHPATDVYPSNGESVISGFAIDFSAGMIYGAFYSSQIAALQETVEAQADQIAELESAVAELQNAVETLQNSLTYPKSND